MVLSLALNLSFHGYSTAEILLIDLGLQPHRL